MFLCESATPLGVPSEPEVNRIAASVGRKAPGQRPLMRQQRAQLVLLRHAIAQILQINQLHFRFERGDEFFQLGLFR